MNETQEEDVARIKRLQYARANPGELLRENDKLRTECDAVRRRLRDTCQIIVAAIGAEGPLDAEDAARAIVARVAALEETIRRWQTRYQPTARVHSCDIPGCVSCGNPSEEPLPWEESE